jgi:hypothetical protein
MLLLIFSPSFSYTTFQQFTYTLLTGIVHNVLYANHLCFVPQPSDLKGNLFVQEERFDRLKRTVHCRITGGYGQSANRFHI